MINLNFLKPREIQQTVLWILLILCRTRQDETKSQISGKIAFEVLLWRSFILPGHLAFYIMLSYTQCLKLQYLPGRARLKKSL